MEWIKIHPDDNVEVSVQTGHKRAIKDIAKGEAVIKYGYSIGNATEDIKAGDHVHSHNLKTGLKEGNVYTYEPNLTELKFDEVKDATFEGYLRENGDVGIRNEIWIVNTVGCVNALAERLSRLTGAKCFPHPYGCSQLGDDHTTTQKILKGLVNHPNAAGVLVLALGCENNTLDSFKALLGDINEKRVKFLVVQKCEDEIEEGVKLIKELEAYRDTFKKQTFPVSKLRVGLKCGGSDGFSGITANPLLGQFSDRLISAGGSTVLTEVPEMFGAETILMNRCVDESIFNKTVDLINNFKAYFVAHNQVIYENPSPGNKEGGITTLEEKSLGCTQKGGKGPVVDVLTYGDAVKKNGLNLLNGPGNDMVAITNLVAAGCHMVLFTTGRAWCTCSDC